MQNLNSIRKPIHNTAQNRLGRLFLSAITVSIGVTAALPSLAGIAATAPANPQPSSHRLEAQVGLNPTVVSPRASLPDGVYLYGQSPKADQVGAGYFVFEVNRGKVMGALYMPRSSFDCASGSFNGDRLALTVVNSYDRTTNPFAIALEGTSNVASSRPEGNLIGLQGFHRISSISQNDYRILNTCKADLKQQQAQK